MSTPQYITLLGATGSIGRSTLAVIDLHMQDLAIFALTAHQDVDAMHKLCLRYQPRYAVMRDFQAANSLRAKLAHTDIEVLAGEDGLIAVAQHPDVAIVVAAIVGASGLLPTIAAAKSGKRILLANKEVLVMAGDLFMQAVAQGKATLIPIDSEHNAIFQVLHQEHTTLRRIILTASGGPFRTWHLDDIRRATLSDAMRHPSWKMGTKVTIDSATLMNKGLEVIEAHMLFGVAAQHIEVLIHPQSIVHSLVEYIDGSVLAQLSNPDMCVPIAFGLGYPARIHSGARYLDLAGVPPLEFTQPDVSRFPCLTLAYQALEQGGTAPTILNASNEIAVQAFIAGRIGLLDIPKIIAQVLDSSRIETVADIEQLLTVDALARTQATHALSC